MSRLSIREKRQFYSSLARLIRAGSPLPIALDLLARDTPRGLGDFLRALNVRIKQGEPLGDALLHQRPKVTELEAGIVSAAGRSGRLDRGCDQLARYFESLERARGQIFSRALYPVVMLHLTIITLRIVDVRFGLCGGSYLWAIALPLGVIYGIVAAIWLGWRAMAAAARHTVAADKFLRMIPGLGPVREKFALARFFATLDAQLEAQVNIWDAFANAAKTSDSARIINAARKAIPMLQAGEKLSEALAAQKVLPDDYIRAFRVAEEAGELDAELTLLAKQSEDMAVAVLDRWAEWLPKIIYLLVLLYAGSQIVELGKAYLSGINNFDPFNQ